VTPRDLLERLGDEGVNLSVKLKVEGAEPPSPETLGLLKRHRDDLIAHLTRDLARTPQMCRLSEQLVDGAVWCGDCYRYQLRPCAPSGKLFQQR
jgi:hypothetical protein